MTLQNIRPRNIRPRNIRARSAADLSADVYGWLRTIVPTITWSARRPARTPRVLGALALLGFGAITALYLAPTNGRELRANTRKGAKRLQKRASELATRAREYQKEYSHPTSIERERTRRSEAASS